MEDLEDYLRCWERQELWALRDEVERQRDYARIQRERIKKLEAFLDRLGWDIDLTPYEATHEDQIAFVARLKDGE